MYIKTIDTKITEWADWAFSNAFYVDFDFAEFCEAPDKYIWQNNQITDISDSDEYITRKSAEIKSARIDELKALLEELDKKRIRAICEPELVQEDVEFDGTWLEYYNAQVLECREELEELGE